jgi:hypothetical protein
MLTVYRVVMSEMVGLAEEDDEAEWHQDDIPTQLIAIEGDVVECIEHLKLERVGRSRPYTDDETKETYDFRVKGIRVHRVEQVCDDIQIAGLSEDSVEDFIASIPWSGAESDNDRTLVAGNIRNFASFIRGR